MGVFSPFTSPQDVRWQGPQRLHHKLFLVKNVILFLFIIIAIVEYALMKKWWHETSYDKDWKYSPYEFWLRIGIALIPDVLVTVLSFVLILNPLHRSTYSLHPVFALVSSILMFLLYVQVCWLNPLLAYSNEVGFHNVSKWYDLAYAETGVQVVLCLFWLALMVCSCMAVHKWKEAKKTSRMAGDVEGHGQELGERNKS